MLQLSTEKAELPVRKARAARPLISPLSGLNRYGCETYFTAEITAASAPSFNGLCSTSLRHAPRATAAITVARMIAPFIVVSPMLSLALPNFDQRKTLRSQPLAKLFKAVRLLPTM